MTFMHSDTSLLERLDSDFDAEHRSKLPNLTVILPHNLYLLRDFYTVKSREMAYDGLPAEEMSRKHLTARWH